MTHHHRVAIWLLRLPTPDVLVHPIRRGEPGILPRWPLALSVPCGKSILSTITCTSYLCALPKLQIDNHQLLGDAEKVARKTRLTSVLEDAKSTEDDKKSAIAAFFLKDKN